MIGLRGHFDLQTRATRSVIFLGITAIFATGCDGKFSSGQYNGNLTTHAVSNVSDLNEMPTKTHVRYDSKKNILAEVFDFDDKNQLLATIKAENFKHSGITKPITFDLTIPSLQAQAISMQQVKLHSKDCYASKSDFQVTLCFDDENFTLDVKQKDDLKLHLFGTRFNVQPPVSYETPEVLTMSQAIDRALDKNDDIQMERETMIQARENMKRAYLSLIPHINFSDAIGIAQGGLLDVIGVMGDFVPFLVPSNWLQARAQQWQCKAEKISENLLKANTATSVQTLGVSYVIDRERYKEIKALKAQFLDALSVVQKLVDQNLLSSKALETFQLNQTNIEISLREADGLIDDDTIALTHMLGYNNPLAVKNITLGSETVAIEDVKILTKEERRAEQERYTNLAIMNSLEIRQQEFLKKSEKLQELGLMLNWASPSSDGLGLTLIADHNIADSILRSLDVQIESIRKSLAAHAFDMVEERDEFRKLYPVVEQSLTVRRSRLAEYLAPITNVGAAMTRGEPVVSFDFKAEDARFFVNDFVEGLNNYYSARSMIQMNQAQLDRLALQGPYEKLLPHLHEVTGTTPNEVTCR